MEIFVQFEVENAVFNTSIAEALISDMRWSAEENDNESNQ